MTVVLVAHEQQRLAELEDQIAEGLATFITVGKALFEVRNGRLYRQDFDTFEHYCDERWGLSRRRADQLIEAATVVGTIVPSGAPLPVNEAQARALAAAPPEERADVMIKVTSEKRPVTSVRIKAEVESRHPKPVNQPSYGRCITCGAVKPASPQHECGVCRAAAKALDEEAGQTAPHLPANGTKPPSTPQRRKPLPDALIAAGWELEKSVDRLERLVSDDRFDRHEGQAATRLRAHLARAVEVCQDLLDRLATDPKGDQ